MRGNVQVSEASLSFLLDCLRPLLLQQDAAAGYSSVLEHLLLEAVPRNLTSQQLQPVAKAAAALFAVACTSAGSRTAVKIAQAFKIRGEQLEDMDGLVEFVQELLQDRLTYTPAVRLMMHFEVRSLNPYFSSEIECGVHHFGTLYRHRDFFW